MDGNGWKSMLGANWAPLVLCALALVVWVALAFWGNVSGDQLAKDVGCFMTGMTTCTLAGMLLDICDGSRRGL